VHLAHVLEAQGEFKESAWPAKAGQPDTTAIADSNENRE
jgi:hypothetical protein